MQFEPDSPAFRVRDALAAGVPLSAMRTAALAAPARGARIGAAHAATDPRAAFIASLRPLARDDQFFSHTTAARVHGMPLPARLADDPIHLASPSFTSRMRREGVVGHRIKAIVVEVDGMRVESVADTFVHLGTSILGVDELIEVGDWIVHPGREPRVSALDLVEHARAFTGARGMRTVAAAIPQLRPGEDSPGETRTRLLLRRAGLPEPVLQHQVRDGAARLVATLDLAYPDHLVGIEYEGAHHRLDAGQFTYDIARYARLEALGWRIVRVTNLDIRDGGRRILPLVRDARRTIGQQLQRIMRFRCNSCPIRRWK